MKAVFYEQHGAPEVLQVGERPTPELQDHEVLVEVVATSVNPIDRRLRSGELQEYITRTFPVVPGWDLAGRIVEVGTKVTHWQVGDEILGLAFTWSIQHGSYAEYCPIDAASITQKPASISFRTSGRASFGEPDRLAGAQRIRPTPSGSICLHSGRRRRCWQCSHSHGQAPWCQGLHHD